MRLEARIPGRCREVVQLRYGLRGSEIYSLGEVAKIMRITKERARQMELHGLDLLCTALIKTLVDRDRIRTLLEVVRMREGVSDGARATES